MVVCLDRFSSPGCTSVGKCERFYVNTHASIGHLWSDGQRLQHLCPRRALARSNRPGASRGTRHRYFGSRMVSVPYVISHFIKLLLSYHGRLLAVNSISLIFAVVANIALLFNMARRLSFNVAQPITIIGWYVASFLLIGLLGAATTGLKLPAGQDRALNQAFYYAIMAAALYFIIATLMVITVVGAYREHYPKEFELTTSQRTLMLQTIAYMVYLLGGAGVFCRVEQWAYLDAVYWANFTLLTVGIGVGLPCPHLAPVVTNSTRTIRPLPISAEACSSLTLSAASSS